MPTAVHNNSSDDYNPQTCQSNQLLNKIMNAITDGVYTLDKDWNFIFVNERVATLAGCSPQEMVGRSSWQFFPKLRGTSYEDNVRRAMLKQKPEVFEWKGCYSNEVWEISVFPSEDGIIVISRDITQRKQAEEALRNSEERFRSVLNNSLDVVYRVNLRTGRYEYMSPSCRTTLGFEPDELLGMSNAEVLSRVHPEDTSSLQKGLARISAVGKGSCVYRFLRKDGNYIWWLNYMVVTKDTEGKPLYRDGYGRDITENKKAEEELRESEEVFSKAFQSNPCVLTITRGADNCMIDVNEAFLSLFGYAREEIIGHTSKELNIFPDYEAQRKIVAEVLDKGRVDNVALEAQTKSGKVLSTLASVEIINIHGESHFLVALLDITDQKALQEKLEAYTKNLEKIIEERTRQLRDAERLAAIGATAGMVGHDIRNPLQAITSDVYLLRSDLALMPDGENKESMKESLKGIEGNVEYVDKIVLDLQDYARQINPVAKEVDIQKILCKDALFRKSIPENIAATCRVEKESQKLITDPDLLKRILSNLIDNAIQAMPDGGKLDAYSYQEAGDTVFVVQDTGAGIPEAIRPNLFKPLFTTKSKGQGLGLAVAKRITDALGGTITYESQVGEGTKFILRLPTKR